MSVLAELLAEPETTDVDLESIRDSTMLEYLLTDSEADFLAAARPDVGTSAVQRRGQRSGPEQERTVASEAAPLRTGSAAGGARMVPPAPEPLGVLPTDSPRGSQSGVRLSLPTRDSQSRRGVRTGIAQHIAEVSHINDEGASVLVNSPAPTQSAVARAVARDEAIEHQSDTRPSSGLVAGQPSLSAAGDSFATPDMGSGELEVVRETTRSIAIDMRDAGAVVARRRAKIRAARDRKGGGAQASGWRDFQGVGATTRKRLWMLAAILWSAAILLRVATLWMGVQTMKVALDTSRPQSQRETGAQRHGVTESQSKAVGVEADPLAMDRVAESDSLVGEAPTLPGQVSEGANVDDGGAVGVVLPTREGARVWQRPGWETDLKRPTQVMYTIRRGGTARTVANLYKIFHHEMEALNPGVPLDRELAPNTRVAVWKLQSEFVSESIGFPGDGSLVGGVPMIEGPGRELKMTPWKSYATIETVAVMDLALRSWKSRYPQAQPILVGNMAAPKGGKLEPHSSHQSGRDVDLGYPQKWDGKSELGWQTMDARNLDRDLTWSLLELLVDTGAVEVIYVDTALQKLLYEHAKSKGNVPEQELSRWMEYPGGPGSNGRAILQHVKGHVDHLHVRFACPAAQARCASRERE